ncbi:MAG: hypothetical protein ACT4O6_22135 [Reyranella sp.]
MRSKIVLLVVAVSASMAGQMLVRPALAATCAAEPWTSSRSDDRTGVLGLLKDVPPDAKWVDLPEAKKAELQRHASNRLAAYRARWGAEALAAKERILFDCPTPEMRTAMDAYVRRAYADTGVPETFSLDDITGKALRNALVRTYLAVFATKRGSMAIGDGQASKHDWDGVSPFDSLLLPDKATNDALKAYAAAIVADLRAIDETTLAEGEKKLRQQLLFDMRALAQGAFDGDSFGGSDLETPCGLIGRRNSIITGYRVAQGRPKIFATDDEVLHEVNAMYLHGTDLKWLDRGTLASAMIQTSCGWHDDNVEKYVKPLNAEVAKGLVLLRKWWIERTSSHPAIAGKCTIFSALDRAAAWDAFSAVQGFNNDGTSSMETALVSLASYRERKIRQYRELAERAVRLVFPDDAVLTAVQRRHILDGLGRDSIFNRYPESIASALDSLNPAAGNAWKRAFETHVTFMGGHDSVRPDEEASIRAMYEEVKNWIARRETVSPARIAPLFPAITLIVNNRNNATASSSGELNMALGTRRSKIEYYATLLHELRHAVNYARARVAQDNAAVVMDSGAAVEGSGVAAELLLGDFLRDTMRDEATVVLSSLEYGKNDGRFIATTDATIRRYLRPDCSAAEDIDTIGYAKEIAVSYGLTGRLADTVAVRAHVGTQYLQYVIGSLPVIEDIAYLQDQIDPSGKAMVDTFLLFACGLNNPRRDEKYVVALRACMKL